MVSSVFVLKFTKLLPLEKSVSSAKSSSSSSDSQRSSTVTSKSKENELTQVLKKLKRNYTIMKNDKLEGENTVLAILVDHNFDRNHCSKGETSLFQK